MWLRTYSGTATFSVCFALMGHIKSCHAVEDGRATHSIAVCHGSDGDHVPAAQHGSPDGAPLIVGANHAVCTGQTILQPLSPASSAIDMPQQARSLPGSPDVEGEGQQAPMVLHTGPYGAFLKPTPLSARPMHGLLSHVCCARESDSHATAWPGHLGLLSVDKPVWRASHHPSAYFYPLKSGS